MTTGISKSRFSNKVVKIETGIELRGAVVSEDIIEFVRLNAPVTARIIAAHFEFTDQTSRTYLRAAVKSGHLRSEKARVRYKASGEVHPADVFYPTDAKEKRR